MLFRLIVPFLCFYASTISAMEQSSSGSEGDHISATSNYSDFSLTPDKSSSSSGSDDGSSSASDGETTSLLSSSDNEGRKLREEQVRQELERCLLEVQKEKKPYNYKEAVKDKIKRELEQNPNRKEIKKLTVTDSVFSIALDPEEKYFAIAADNKITLYSADTGEPVYENGTLKQLPLKKPIIKIKFIDKSTVRAFYTGAMHTSIVCEDKTLYCSFSRPKKYYYIDVPSLTKGEKIIDNETIKNQLQKEDAIETSYASVHITTWNKLDSHDPREMPLSLEESGRVLVHGSKRCISLTGSPLAITLYDIEDAYKQIQKSRSTSVSSEDSTAKIFPYATEY